MNHTAYLLLGSNEGNRKLWIEKGLAGIRATCGHIAASSGFYETAAWRLADQPDFLNVAVKIQTALSPQDLLQAIQQIETQLERQRAIKWGQRTLDIDILFYEDLIIHTPSLKIPHPYIQERRFALVPLAAIAAEFIHPVLQVSVSALLENCKDRLDVRKYINK